MRSALEVHVAAKTWMPGTSPGMTIFGTSRNFIGLYFESVRSPDGAQRDPGIATRKRWPRISLRCIRATSPRMTIFSQ